MSFLSRVDSFLTFGVTHWRKVATMLEKAKSTNSLLFAVPFHRVLIFVWVLIKHDVVVAIKMGAYIHGSAYPDFTVCSFTAHSTQ